MSVTVSSWKIRGLLFVASWWLDLWLVVSNIFSFSHILGIIIPIDFHIFQLGGSTTNQILFGTDYEWCFSWCQALPQILATIATLDHAPSSLICGCSQGRSRRSRRSPDPLAGWVSQIQWFFSIHKPPRWVFGCFWDQLGRIGKMKVPKFQPSQGDQKDTWI